MVSGVFYIPKERRSHPKGQDAHFICKEKQTIGVADGVGKLIDQGIDSGKYARKLMSNFVGELDTMEINNRNIDLKEILEKAYSKTHKQGSSTACILTLMNNSLHAANVGDSGFLLIRNGVEFYKSPIQVNRFNCPYQLGICHQKPKAAQNIVNISSGAEAEQVARTIAEHAYYNSIDKAAPTPFTKACFEEGHERYGGKEDDITVIVSFIIN
ncbi:hypothetical protein ACJIZ3_004175 [Penstemon smallii]|uniref:Protein phosphatase n=1 Tax=Penstemon smallii TaxID=265156 RepID=A0ABD3S1E9_9LAMI